MLRHLIKSAAGLILFTGAAGAQVLPGDSPNSGIGAAVSNSRSRPLLGLSHRSPDYQSNEDDAYRKAAKTVPDRKPQKDPWANMRQAPTASSVDRHRVE